MILDLVKGILIGGGLAMVAVIGLTLFLLINISINPWH